MAIKVAIIGAGSVGFTLTLVKDILGVPELQDAHFALMDISRRNVDMTGALLARDIKANKLPARITVTTDRAKAVAGADYVFCTIRQGGLAGFQTDIDIPLQYGVDQCVGDTLCAGGIMYGQRGIPALLDICADIRRHAKPQALLMNYANPMAMNTWACNQYGGVRTLGLCHGVQGMHHQIAAAFGKKPAEVDLTAAGINHQTWALKIILEGREISGEELLAAFAKNKQLMREEKVRMDVLKRFGYYSTESNGHLSEYVPWYRKRPRELTRWIDLGVWINGETGGYLRVCTEGRNWFETDFPQWLKAPAAQIGPEHRSAEHGGRIIEALETGRTYRGHFNVVNRGCIPNLPPDAIVEVPAYVDRNGISVPRVGDLPLACAATCNVSISVQRMAVEAAVHGDVTLLKQAMLHDPLTGAVCNPEEIWQMTDKMLVAGEKWLPQYRQGIAEAKKRLAREKNLGVHKSKGAARLRVKTVAEMQRAAAAERKRAQSADKAGMTG